MSETPRRKGLGRGLAALIDDSAQTPRAPSAGGAIALDLIEPNPDQPRKRFDQEEIESLAATIREQSLQRVEPQFCLAGLVVGAVALKTVF